jgi:hypothetical protein
MNRPRAGDILTPAQAMELAAIDPEAVRKLGEALWALHLTTKDMACNDIQLTYAIFGHAVAAEMRELIGSPIKDQLRMKKHVGDALQSYSRPIDNFAAVAAVQGALLELLVHLLADDIVRRRALA